jgi:hypothetical protein
MSKMASHESFGHLQHKLWSKEGPGVKLVVWLPTTQSQESTRPRCVRVECDIPLKSSQGELEVCFKPHPDRRSGQGVMSCQSPDSPNRGSFGAVSELPSPGTKGHLDVVPVEWHKVYYMGEGVGFPRVRAVVSQVSQSCPWLVLAPRVLQNVNFDAGSSKWIACPSS